MVCRSGLDLAFGRGLLPVVRIIDELGTDYPRALVQRSAAQDTM